VNVWNTLPIEVVTAPTVNCFKERFDRHCRRNMFVITMSYITNQFTGNLPTRLKDDDDDDDDDDNC